MNEHFVNLISQTNNEFNDLIINDLRNNGLDDHIIDIIGNLYRANNQLFSTINFDFVKSDFFKNLKIDMLRYITTLEITQKELLSLDEKKQNIFLFMINNYSNNLYWPPYFSALLKNLNSNEFDSLINSINLKELDKNDLNRLSCILTSKSNNLMISTQEQLKNYDNIVNQNVLNSLNNNDINQYKNSVLLQKFNLSLNEVKTLCQKYCFNLEDLKVENDFLEVLKTIKKIVLATSINDISNITNNLTPLQLEYPSYQTLSQNLYEEEYNRLLFDPKNHDGIIVDGVKIVDAGTDFYMISRADGAFTYDENNNQNINYYNNWNLPNRSTYSFSNSHISNSRLLMYALQSKKGLITYAFSNLPRNSIVENALGDNATLGTRKKTIDPRAYNDGKKVHPYAFDGCGQRFLSFGSMIDHSSRRTHTEITLERFYYDNNGNEQRLNPSYIVYTKINDDYKNDELYKKSLKAAKDFNVPLVIIDFKKVLESERNKMNYYLNQPLNIDNIKKSLQIYSNNSIQGLKDKYQSVINNYFPNNIDNKNYCEILISEIINKAKNQSFPTEFFQELFDYLMVLNIEKKIISSGYLVSMKEKLSLNENLNKYYDEIWGITYPNCDEREKSDCLYDYFRWKKIIDKLNKYNIKPDKFFSEYQYTLASKIELCEKEGIIPTEDLLLLDRNILGKEISEHKEELLNPKVAEVISTQTQEQNQVEINTETLDIQSLPNIINPSLMKKMMRLPNGVEIPAKQYIQEVVYPYLPQNGIVILNNGAVLSVKQFIEECVMFECQEKYSGDFPKYMTERTRNNLGVVSIGNEEEKYNIKPVEITDIINPSLLETIVRLSSGIEITARQYIQEVYAPHIPSSGNVILSNGVKISVKQYIEEVLFSIGQEQYSGNIERILYNTTRNNTGTIINDPQRLQETLMEMRNQTDSLNNQQSNRQRR